MHAFDETVHQQIIRKHKAAFKFAQGWTTYDTCVYVEDMISQDYSYCWQ